MPVDSNRTNAIEKVLSSNDTGETGSHQAGTHIPKSPSLLSFFPKLDSSYKNPRIPLNFMDEDGVFWNFSFIYYNNKLFGGTRDEYRLTGMTKYLRKYYLKTGDRLTLYRDDRNRYRIKFTKSTEKSPDVLELGSAWKIINI